MQSCGLVYEWSFCICSAGILSFPSLHECFLKIASRLMRPMRFHIDLYSFLQSVVSGYHSGYWKSPGIRDIALVVSPLFGQLLILYYFTVSWTVYYTFRNWFLIGKLIANVGNTTCFKNILLLPHINTIELPAILRWFKPVFLHPVYRGLSLSFNCLR